MSLTLMQCKCVSIKSGLLLKCSPHLSVSDLDSDLESHKILYCATISLTGNAVKDIGGQHFIVSKYFPVCFWKYVWVQGSNHSRMCPCLKKVYFEIDHFLTPCSLHGEVDRIPYHDHNSTTAETELKYLRTYGSIIRH